jgi:predicted metal-dependent hydrolase
MISSDLTFELDGRPVPYRLRLSARCRRMGLRFSDDGLEVVKPPRLQGTPHEFLFQRFEGWIRRQILRRERREKRVARESDHFLLRGQELRLRVREAPVLDGFATVAARADVLEIETSRGGAEVAARSLRTFIFAEARRDLTERLAARAAEMGQAHGAVRIADQKSLWGSCSPGSGTLSFNARLVMAPPAVLDYIVVHELAHFRWSRHGVRFWERVARFCPDYRLHRRWLRENAWRLRLPATAEEMSPFLVE